MTNNEAILILKTYLASMKLNSSGGETIIQEAFSKAIDAFFKLEMIKSYGYRVYEKSAEHDCTGCEYENVDVCQDPCRICARNCKDHYREAEK